jgi:rod shape-determining protein MreC
MENLIIFLTRYRVILVFILLELFCLNLVIRYNKNQQEIFVNSAQLFSGWMFEKSQIVGDYFQLQSLADSLANDNARLRTLLDKYSFDFNLKRDTILDSVYRQEYQYIPAKVVNNLITLWDNTLTLNRGSNHGIRPGMGVISDKGIVGIIQTVSPHFSQAISLLNSNIRVSASHQNSGQFGTLYWDGRNSRKISLKDVPKYAKVAVKDTIITNRYSAIFPEGIGIGTIDTFWVERGTNFYYIEIGLFQDFSKLNSVYVVDYLYKEEQLSVEKKPE